MREKNIWDVCRRRKIMRTNTACAKGIPCQLEGGVVYFVLMLEQLGGTTVFSCEGHPDGFYITFTSPYVTALHVKDAGFFHVNVEGANYWSLRFHEEGHSIKNGKPVITKYSYKERAKRLRWTAQSWEERLGPLEATK